MSFHWSKCSGCSSSRPPEKLTAGVCNDDWHAKLDEHFRAALAVAHQAVRPEPDSAAVIFQAVEKQPEETP